MKRTALIAAIAALAVAGCGSDDSSDDSSASSDTTASQAPAPTTDTGGGGSSGGASTNLQVAADESGALTFDRGSLNAKAGKVTITMDNPSPVPHAIAVEGGGVDEDGKTVTMGGKSTVTVDLKAGSYTFYCPVDGHKAAGMSGALTVK